MFGKLYYSLILLLGICPTLQAQTLEQSLLATPAKELIKAVQEQGDARRGAIVFHHAVTGCAKCHSVAPENDPRRLGPNLALLKGQENISDEQILSSILQPSASIRKGYESVTVLRIDGTVLTGLKLSQNETETKIRDTTGQDVVIPAAEIEEVVLNKLSIMPAGVINTVGSRQQFLDLARYVFAIRDEGPELARELQPPKSLIAFEVPEYEAHVDHQGLIKQLDEEAFKRGEAIYGRLCINCHGNLDQPGSLPTALRFGEGKFRNGNDPFAMYRTLTHGFGLMVPQTWMVPQQKYDVIHYIRETYLKLHNPSQYQPVEEGYLASLPKGDTFGPEPTEFSPWRDMNYGPWMHNTIEVSQDGSNIAYKGLVVRLDAGPGGVSQGNQWLLFDHDTMRVAAGWQHLEGSDRFIDWQGIHFDGRHQAHPHVVGEVLFSNPNGPGWANPQTGSFADDQRVIGRDEKRYGPLPKTWARYHSMQRAGESISVSYSVGEMGVTEHFSIQSAPGNQNLFLRTLQLQPTRVAQRLLIDTDEHHQKKIKLVSDQIVLWQETQQTDHQDSSAPEWMGDFDGKAWLETAETDQLNMSTRDFSITARIKTSQDGVIFAQTQPGPKWVPDGTALF
ncbi:MAG: c-type cytochrome, partial [Planctomycetaceae bacterium]|nr:c-type cytochrome [Planctomycetaceae bacterium]